MSTPGGTPDTSEEKPARRRDQVEKFIAAYSVSHGGNAPSLQEIADALGISKRTAELHVTKLMAERRADRLDNKLLLVGANYKPPPSVGT